MRYLHDDLKVYHRDLKGDNILMGLKIGDPYNEDERQPTIKVTDFTTAGNLPVGKEDEYRVTTRAGTEPYIAPECHSQSSYLVKPLDVWAYAMTLYVYLVNEFPFDDSDLHKIKDALSNTDDLRAVMLKTLAEHGYSDHLIDVMDKMLATDPTARPSFQSIVNHEWFSGRHEEQLSTEIDIE